MNIATKFMEVGAGRREERGNSRKSKTGYCCIIGTMEHLRKDKPGYIVLSS